MICSLRSTGLLITVGRFLNFLLHITVFNGCQGTPHGVNFLDVGHSPLADFVRQVFNDIRAGQGVHRICHPDS